MPAKTVTVYVCDRCRTEESEGGESYLWQGVIIPTDDPVQAGQQLLCGGCVAAAKAFMSQAAA